MSNAIEINNVWKKYRIYHDRAFTLKERVLFKGQSRYDDFWALKGLSLEIEKGKSVGLVGQNGSGKSTLLKLLTRIIYPDRGRLKINGKVSSLLELGAGFHPDFTGLENIYMNAAIFGMTKKEIDCKLEEIIDFSELGDFIYSPVRTYSSGMYMRLAFSVAINVDADILLIDEILAVGDANFQAKCLKKLNELKRKEVTIIIVSHDISTIEYFCNKAIFIEHGCIQKYGDSQEVSNLYRHFMSQKLIDGKKDVNENSTQTDKEYDIDCKELQSTKEISEKEQKRLEKYGNDNHWGNNEVEITNAYLTGKDGRPETIFYNNEPIIVNIEYLVHKKQDEYVFGAGFYGRDRIMYFGTNTTLDGQALKDLPEKGVIKLIVEQTNFLPGEYTLHVSATNIYGMDLDFYRFYSDFQIICDDKAVGLIGLKRKWTWEKC